MDPALGNVASTIFGGLIVGGFAILTASLAARRAKKAQDAQNAAAVVIENQRAKDAKDAADAAVVADADKALRPGSWEAMVKRFDAQDAIIRALAGVVFQVADQWQGDHPPHISPRYVAVLAEYNFIPADWTPAQ